MVQVPPPQPKRKPSNRMVFLFGMKRTLRCMKHEVALRAMKRACGHIETISCASLHASESECIILAKPMLHGGKAAASLCKEDVFLLSHTPLAL